MNKGWASGEVEDGKIILVIDTEEKEALDTRRRFGDKIIVWIEENSKILGGRYVKFTLKEKSNDSVSR